MSPHLRARIRNNQTWTAGRLAVTAYAVRRRRKSPDRIIRIAVTGDGPALELRSSHALPPPRNAAKPSAQPCANPFDPETVS